jgi:hypothetical protein
MIAGAFCFLIAGKIGYLAQLGLFRIGGCRKPK